MKLTPEITNPSIDLSELDNDREWWAIHNGRIVFIPVYTEHGYYIDTGFQLDLDKAYGRVIEITEIKWRETEQES